MAAEPHRDAYRILQVVPEAHPDVIRAAYYALARIYHPDGDRSDTDLMSDLNWAYDQIRDRVRREAYDRARAAYRQPLGYGQMPVGPGHDDSSRPVAPPPPADRPSEAAGPFARARPTDPGCASAPRSCATCRPSRKRLAPFGLEHASRRRRQLRGAITLDQGGATGSFAPLAARRAEARPPRSEREASGCAGP